jgi:hypothetical protein
MSNIADVIGWKFNNQPGMVCKTINGTFVITEFPGGVPSQVTQDGWTAEYAAFVAGGGLLDQSATSDLDATKMLQLNFAVNFDQENRIRTLEGKPTITKAQYRAALVTVWKSL